MKKYGSLFIFSIILFISGILIWSFYFDVQMTVFGITINEKGLLNEAFYFYQILLYLLAYSVLCTLIALCFHHLKNKKISHLFIGMLVIGIVFSFLNLIIYGLTLFL